MARSPESNEAARQFAKNEAEKSTERSREDDVIERLRITIKDSTVVRRVKHTETNRLIAAHYEATGELLELDREE